MAKHRLSPDAAAESRAIERAAAMSNATFVDELMRPRQDSGWPDWTHPRTGRRYGLRVRRAGDLTRAQMNACFALVQVTSGDDYRASAGGWRPAAKRREMAAAELRYVLVVPLRMEKKKKKQQQQQQQHDVEASGDGDADPDSDDPSSSPPVAAFTSFMATFEAGDPVVYCYEIHLDPALQGSGLGRLLMGLVARVAAGLAPVRKTMLTCFVANARARRFYEALGYGVDESSPRERRLRGGRVVAPDYVILSRPTTPGP